ncbi:MAG TPA: ATP-dependent Clp protease ATP-binding subunit [Candidatus Saccharimonadia bacterium]
MSTTLGIKLTDLIARAKAGRFTDVVGRDTELNRLVRLLLRPSRGHVALIGEPGSGKTSLTQTLARRRQAGLYGALSTRLYQLDTQPILSLLMNGDSLRQCYDALRQATHNLPNAIIIVEDIQLLAADDPSRLELTLSLLQALASHNQIKLVVTTTPTAYQRLFQGDYSFNRTFDPLELTEADQPSAITMVEAGLPRLEAYHHLQVSAEAVAASVEYGSRFKHGRALPDAALRIIEEACVDASLEAATHVTKARIQQVVAERERLPLADLDAARSADLAALEHNLQQAVVGQVPAIQAIARTITKSQLGLGDTTRPRGSFLLLGPSGVGKTETAKAIAKHVYANPKALVRLDMSEYGEPHAAVRLIGSPPGYVGYEEGGQLTGAVAREPYSLVLLDEIEKAHPKVFDLFLQLLDDGRLTDSAGQTVDFTGTTVLATSNVGSQEIALAAQAGINVNSPDYLQSALQPLLLKHYRPEFINRFDAVIAYQPLGEAHLVTLAQRELGRLSQRLERLGVQFDVPNDILARQLRPLLNPLFGARPVKRMIAQYYETPIANAIIAGQLPQATVITGTEAWLTPEVSA